MTTASRLPPKTKTDASGESSTRAEAGRTAPVSDPQAKAAAWRKTTGANGPSNAPAASKTVEQRVSNSIGKISHGGAAAGDTKAPRVNPCMCEEIKLNHTCLTGSAPSLAVNVSATCASRPCFPGVQCINRRPPHVGYVCGRCPPGLYGNGRICMKSSKEGKGRRAQHLFAAFYFVPVTLWSPSMLFNVFFLTGKNVVYGGG